MARAVAVINAVVANPDGSVLVFYSVAIDDGKNFSSDSPVSFTQTIPQFFTAARNRVSADCAGKGSTVLPADVIICGGPA